VQNYIPAEPRNIFLLVRYSYLEDSYREVLDLSIRIPLNILNFGRSAPHILIRRFYCTQPVKTHIRSCNPQTPVEYHKYSTVIDQQGVTALER
jgi:hypothetical protein